MTEIKTIFGTYAYFNEIPVHSVFIWGDGLKFIKLANAIPDVGMSKQPPNCFDLQKQHYCTMTAKHKVKLVKQTADYNTEVIAENSGDKGDLISREALKAYARKVICGDNPTNSLIIRMFDEIIDNAPAVYNNPYSDGREDGYIEGYEVAKRECEPQGEFTDLERKVTADAINYLLGAELLEENGYTEDVINALKSALQKLGAEEDHL